MVSDMKTKYKYSMFFLSQHGQRGRPSNWGTGHFSNEQEADGIERGANENDIGDAQRRGLLAIDSSGTVEGDYG